MQIPCLSEFTDGSKSNFSITKPAGALPDSLLTALEAIKAAESESKKVRVIGINSGPMVAREEIMKQARVACPQKVF